MKKIIAFILPALFFLNSCISQEPSEIQLHTDECTYCKMVISDERFPAQLVSDKGKSYPFDSIECMAAYQHQNPEIAEGAKLYVTDFSNPGKWIPVEESAIHRSDDIQSPMGLSLFAVAEGSSVPDKIEHTERQEWHQTLEYVITRWNLNR